MHLSAKRRGVVRHRRDKTRIRRAKPLVNGVGGQQSDGVVIGHHVKAGREHSSKMSHVMAGRSRQTTLSRKQFTRACATLVTMSQQCGGERLAEVVGEQSVNAAQDADHERELPQW